MEEIENEICRELLQMFYVKISINLKPLLRIISVS